MYHKKVWIIIQYRLIDDNEWTTLNLSPENYFDLEQGEEVEVDSVPLFNHAIDYIDANKEKVANTKITIEDSNTKSKVIITETFWNNQQNRIIERIDVGKTCSEELIIVETQIQNNPLIYEIVRFVRKEGILTPEYHGFISENLDGSQFETKVLE